MSSYLGKVIASVSSHSFHIVGEEIWGDQGSHSAKLEKKFSSAQAGTAYGLCLEGFTPKALLRTD